MPSSSSRLAFTHISPRAWAGGYNYLANLFASLDAHQNGRLIPVVFAGLKADEKELDELAKIPSVQIVRAAAFDRKQAGLADALITGLDHAAARVFKCHSIDVVIETANFFGWRLPYPSIAWFPDFQHRRLPHLSSKLAWLRREAGLRMQIASARTIMLSSEDARRDCEHFYPSLKNRTRVVRFATHPRTSLLAVDCNEVIRKYGLPSCFFYLPNQFYRHKNHQVVIDALDVLRRRGIEIVVAASGSANDANDKNYFPDLMMQIEQRGLQKNFRYLGMMPIGDVYPLLRSSAALINPSSFEGWSTTVEEAKSFGAPMILSDIPVHREQAGETALYFGLKDSSALADQLASVTAVFKISNPRNPVAEIDSRVAAFASDFANTVDWARTRRSV